LKQGFTFSPRCLQGRGNVSDGRNLVSNLLERLNLISMKTHIAAGHRKDQAQPPGVLTIRNFQTTSDGEHREVSAEVDGDRVFFRAPLHYEIGCHAEPFVGIALLEAMIRNVDIQIEDSIAVSDKFFRALPEIQAIYTCWNTDLRPIRVHARTQPCDETFERVASFYSGGVDGSHTLCRNFSDISHLVMLPIELAGNSPELWRKSVAKNAQFARSIGKELVPIETNAKEWTDKRRIHWAFAQGLVLASMGRLLQAKRLYIASSHRYDQLFPWGSHTLTDPMWSTESTNVIHDGAAFRRSEKMKEICKNEQVMNNLRVCWRSIYDNCGKCSKCIRTMTALYLLGVSTQALPRFENSRGALSKFRIHSEAGATYVEDAMILAKEAGNTGMHRALRHYHRMYQMRKMLKMVDKYVLGGIMRRTYRSYGTLGRSKWKPMRVEVRGSEDWDV
jgi:hypothetical protein